MSMCGSEGDSDDQAWLLELCRAPRRSLQATLSDASDDSWLHELCRGQRARSDDTVTPMTASSTSSGVLAVKRPQKKEEEGSSGVLAIKQPQKKEDGYSGVLAIKQPQKKPQKKEDGSSGVLAVRRPCDGPWRSMSQLALDLESAQLPLPAKVWPLPVQADIQADILWDAVSLLGGSSWDTVLWLGGSGVPVLQRCLWRIAAWGAALKVCIFKVGIAYDPVHRWGNADFGYVTEQVWMFMDVLYCGPVGDCRSLEIDLIARLRAIAGCYNEKPGGEGISEKGSGVPAKCYCYCVFAPAGSGLGVRAEWQRHKRSVSEVSGVQVKCRKVTTE